MADYDLVRDLGISGIAIARGIFPSELYESFRSDVVSVAETLLPRSTVGANGDIDQIWKVVAGSDRRLASMLYDAMKYSVALRRFATYQPLLELVGEATGSSALALVDVNFRIDAPGEGHFLFSWHQDFWFSICSPKALVVWIPMTQLTLEAGGIECLPLSVTGGRILNARRADHYKSYSDSIVLDEPVPEGEPILPDPCIGDAVLFSFDVLHRSRPNLSVDRCRWTAQLRFVNFQDLAFRGEGYRPGVVTQDRITYLERIEKGAGR